MRTGFAIMAVRFTNLARLAFAAALAAGLLIGLAASTACAQDPFAAPMPPAAGAPAAGAAADGAADPFGAAGAKPPPPAAKPGEEPGITQPEPLVILQLRESNPTTPEQLVRAARAVFQFGRPDEAKQYLAKLLAGMPAEDDLAALPGQFGSTVLLRFAREPALQPEGKQVADLVFAAAEKMVRDPGRINAYIAQLSDPSVPVRSSALSRLELSGTHAVTPMLRVLADAGREKEHPFIRSALAEMAAATERPLLGALDIPSDYVKAQVILVLARMGSTTAIPRLVGPSLNASASPEVRAAASAALTKLVGQTPDRYEGSVVLRKEIARLLRGNMPFRPDHNNQVEMWTWDETNRELVSRQLPAPDAALMLAARLADDLHVLQANNQALRARLLLNLELAKVVNGLDQPLPTGQGSAAAMAAAAGAPVVNQVLGDALKLSRIPAAIAAAEVLGQLGDASVLTSAGSQESPLALAMLHPDRRVRFTAALTALKLKPSEAFPGASHILENLGYAVATSGVDRVLVAHPRGQDAQTLIGYMNELGYDGSAAYVGRALAYQAMANPDCQFILISDAIDTPPVKELVQWLRRDYRTARMPVGVMARGENLESLREALKDDPFTTVFPAIYSSATAAIEVDRLLLIAGRNRIDRDERLDHAAAALTALAVLAQSPSSYMLHDLLRQEPAVINALDNPALTLPAARVLALLGTPKSQTALVDFASRHARPLADRQAVAAAFAAAVQSRGLNLTQQQILLQYDRYNDSATLDPATQQLLGSILDALEAPTAMKENALSKNN